MPEPKTNCTKCGREILQATANRNDGLCAPCVNDIKYPPPDLSQYENLPGDPIELDVEIDIESLGTPEAIAWEQVEDALVLLASKYVEAFGAIHADKQFYGIAFDCNADYGQVYLCANTVQALKKRAVEYRTRHADLYGKQTLAELEDHLRWGLGDWEFCAGDTDGFSDAWEPLEDFLRDAFPLDDDDDEEDGRRFRKAFLATACRAMVRLETEGALNALNRTADFKTYVADHDETEEDSWNRLATISKGSSNA